MEREEKEVTRVQRPGNEDAVMADRKRKGGLALDGLKEKGSCLNHNSRKGMS